MASFLALLTLPVLALVAVLLYKLASTGYDLYRKAKAVRNIPGLPDTHWFFGNILQFKEQMEHEEKALEFIRYMVGNKIKLSKGWIGPFAVVLDVHHCSLLPQVLKLPKNKVVYDFLRPWLGDGLLVSEGNKWFRNRRLLTPAFHYEVLMPYVAVYNKCVQVMINKWSTSAKVNDPVELFESISLLSLDIILQCSFSFSSDCQVMEHKHRYIDAIQEIVELTSKRMVHLLSRINWIFYLTPAGRKYTKYLNLARNFTRKVIQKRKRDLQILANNKVLSEDELKAKKKGKYLDFLDILLIARDEDGKGLNDQEIQDEVDTFMFEGHDTTTSGMCWTLYCLAKHPEHQEKVREEVRSVLMGRECLEYDDLKELKYTQWCIKEAMRLYPPVFFLGRETAEGCELNGIKLLKGTQVAVNVRSVHLNPVTWEDPEKYDPLRFHPSNCEGRHPFAYIPFSGGQRNCIGQNFALNEERVVIASIVNRFKLTLVEGHKVESSPFVVLRSKKGIKVKLTVLSRA